MLGELWDAAWSTSVWSEVLADSLPVPDYIDDEGYSCGSYKAVHVDILIERAGRSCVLHGLVWMANW